MVIETQEGRLLQKYEELSEEQNYNKRQKVCNSNEVTR